MRTPPREVGQAAMGIRKSGKSDAKSTSRSQEAGDALDRLQVADTVEQLRRQMEHLISRLTHAEQSAAASGDENESTAVGAAEAPKDLDRQIEAVSRKVDQASDLLSEMTDLLEAQSERIETLESQVGDPDLRPVEPRPERSIEAYQRRLEVLESKLVALASLGQSASRDMERDDEEDEDEDEVAASRVTSSMPPPTDTDPEQEARREPPHHDEDALQGAEPPMHEVLALIMDRIDENFALLSGRIDRLDGALSELRNLAGERERQVRDLEERLLILVDSASPSAEVSSTASTSPPDVRGAPPPLGPSASGVRELPGDVEQPYDREAWEAGSQPAAASGQWYETAPEHATELPQDDYARTAAFARERTAAELRGAGEHVARRRSGAERASRSDLEGIERIVERELSILPDRIEAVAPGHGATEPSPRKRRPTVMVVDDSTDARTILSVYLSKTGFQVVTASSAEDCLAKLRHHEVDAIVLDASLPGADGGHVCRVLRSEAAYSDKRAVPVIVYTGYPDEYTRSLVGQWAADDYVIKGGDMLPLITSLVRHTGGRPARPGRGLRNGA